MPGTTERRGPMSSELADDRPSADSVRACTHAVRPDIVVMCSTILADTEVPVLRLDWTFVS